MLLGGSWFTAKVIPSRLTGKRPNADTLNLVVGGDFSKALLERFASQRGNQNADVMWLIVKATVFDGLVASKMLGSTALIEKSRQYADLLAYLTSQ